ncbi:MAG: hypothetical protein AAGI44_02355 [Pseudomonadota bacterium]
MAIVAVKTPEQVTAMKDAEAQQRRENAALSYRQPEFIDNLAAYVRDRWSIAKQSKQPVTARLIDCLQRRNGMYSPEKLAAIRKTQGSEIYMQLTGAKCRAAKAYLSDLYTPSGDRPFTVDPTPVPELPPELQRTLMFEAISVLDSAGVEVTPQDAQAIIMRHRDRLLDELHKEAEKRAEKMADKIEDMLVEAKFRTEFDAFLDDLVTYPAAILKGPVFTQKRKIQWVDMGDGTFEPKRERVVIPEVRRVSPFDDYPSPGIRDTFEGHWNIEHRRFSFQQLADMRDAPGYKRHAIEYVLSQYRNNGLTEWLWSEDEHLLLTGGLYGTYGRRETIDALEWTGTIQGARLVEWGIDPKTMPDMYDEYPVSIMVIGNVAVRALINPDPAGKPDYFKACWENVPGSFWGKALPEIMSDCQDMCNGAARALANNLGIASGPQVWVDTAQLATGADITSFFPWKIWPMNTKGVGNNTSRDPIGFWQPNSHAKELLAVYERWSKYADEITGMPAFAYGSDQGAGAAKTASGLSMLLNASSKTIKSVVHNIDIHVIEPLVEKFYNHIMLFVDDPSLKGDAVAKARGSESLIHKEAAQARAQELLAITANPMDSQIIGQEGRRELLAQTMAMGDMPVDRIVPSPEELAERNKLFQQMANDQQMQAEQEQAMADAA